LPLCVHPCPIGSYFWAASTPSAHTMRFSSEPVASTETRRSPPD
jgi:hypothetical protein